jgi:hypothetical protein
MVNPWLVVADCFNPGSHLVLQRERNMQTNLSQPCFLPDIPVITKVDFMF